MSFKIGYSSAAVLALSLAMSGCGGGGGGSAPQPSTGGNNGGNAGGAGGGVAVIPDRFDDPLPRSLSVSDVEAVVSAAVAEATARNTPSTIAVTDRVGNVLAVYTMVGAEASVNVPEPASGITGGLQGASFPATLGAIAKAITGAYLSSGGNAFSSRVASQIVQEHFPPAPGLTNGLESGPLFGVQFSQLPCSDLSTRFSETQGPFIGPNRSPVGLSADPGGFPLYKDGVVVGGIGVIADDEYGFDPDTQDVDSSDEEAIALAAASLFEAPDDIKADRITVDGTQLRYSDATDNDFLTDPTAAPLFGTLTAATGALTPVRGYFGQGTVATVQAGTTYGTERSGIRPSSDFATPDAYVLSDGFGSNRYPPSAGTDGGAVTQPLTSDEVTALLEEAFNILSQSRAQIRRPLNSRAQVTVSVVDTNGQILGVIRSPDGPIFGTDVSLQKARTAAFFSGDFAAADLNAAGKPGTDVAGSRNPAIYIANTVQRVRDFLGDPTALTGTFAFADRSGGNLSRPYFPDGELNTAPGPLSVAIEDFNPFDTGLQSSLVVGNVGGHIAFVTGQSALDIRQGCTALPNTSAGENRLQNGIQIFPGSVPIYRGSELIGGIGVSGDGIDQDDMISFLGLHNAGLRTGTINNAPNEIRADRIVVNLGDRNVRLRYINCPFSPFVDSDEQNVCQGK